MKTFLSTLDERSVVSERGGRKKSFGLKFMSNAIIATARVQLLRWNKLGRKRSSFHHHMLIPSWLEESATIKLP